MKVYQETQYLHHRDRKRLYTSKKCLRSDLFYVSKFFSASRIHFPLFIPWVAILRFDSLGQDLDIYSVGFHFLMPYTAGPFVYQQWISVPIIMISSILSYPQKTMLVQRLAFPTTVFSFTLTTSLRRHLFLNFTFKSPDFLQIVGFSSAFFFMTIKNSFLILLISN